MSLRFTQSCPTCGRRVEVRAALLGCTVACQHCRAEFVAEPGVSIERPRGLPLQSDSSDDLMARVEELLQRTDQPTHTL